MSVRLTLKNIELAFYICRTVLGGASRLHYMYTSKCTYITHCSRSRGNSIDNQILHRSQACSKTRNRQINICSHLSRCKSISLEIENITRTRGVDTCYHASRTNRVESSQPLHKRSVCKRGTVNSEITHSCSLGITV